MHDVGIVVVTYNSAEHIATCLASALATGAQVIVVDNASKDDTVVISRDHGAEVIANNVNRGFAAAVNQGVRSVRTPYILLLNPDCIVQSGLAAMRACCELPGSAGCGGKLVN